VRRSARAAGRDLSLPAGDGPRWSKIARQTRFPSEVSRVLYLLALLPATALTIAGYFVLYFSARAEGGLRTFGKYLGFWAFTLAGLIILGAIFAAAHGHRMRGMHDGMRGGMHCPWMGPHPWMGPREPAGGTPPPPPAGGPAPNAEGAAPPTQH
jgi:hypothetical protein